MYIIRTSAISRFFPILFTLIFITFILTTKILDFYGKNEEWIFLTISVVLLYFEWIIADILSCAKIRIEMDDEKMELHCIKKGIFGKKVNDVVYWKEILGYNYFGYELKILLCNYRTIYITHPTILNDDFDDFYKELQKRAYNHMPHNF